MDLNGRIRNTLVSYLVTAISIFGIVSSLKLMAQAKTPESKPMPRGVTCYLLGPVEIKAKTTDEVDQQLQKLEELYKQKKIQKALYDFRKKDLLKIKSDMENKNSDFMNYKMAKKQTSIIRSLYQSYFRGLIDKKSFEGQEKEARKKILELTNDPELAGPTVEELKTYESMLKTIAFERNIYGTPEYQEYSQMLQSQIAELINDEINTAFAKEFELLELQRKNNEIDQQAYKLKKEILEQQKIYALRHSSMTKEHYAIKVLNQKRNAGEIPEADFDKQLLKTLKRINERELQMEQEDLINPDNPENPENSGG